MGYRQAKRQALECIADARIEHELNRCEIDVKNLLVTGVVTAAQVADAIGRSSGTEYECCRHHYDENIEVHIIKTRHGDKSWYIKGYFISPNVVFVSVHE